MDIIETMYHIKSSNKPFYQWDLFSLKVKEMNVGMTSEELQIFIEKHKRHAEVRLVGNNLEILLKNKKGKIADLITLTLNEDMTIHPLQAVDEIITVFQLEGYK